MPSPKRPTVVIGKGNEMKLPMLGGIQLRLYVWCQVPPQPVLTL